MTNSPDGCSADIVEAVTDELLAHGEFSSGANNRSNAREAARVVVDMVRTFDAAQPSPAATVETADQFMADYKRDTLSGMIEAVYGQLDAEDCAVVDREWARQRGYILPTAGTSTLSRLSAATGNDEFRACQLHWPEPYGSTIGRAADEIDRLCHDIERHIQIATDLCNEVPQTALVSELADAAEAHFLPVEQAARFLLDRLDEFDPGEDDPEREYHGHVAPAIARLRYALAATEPQPVPVTADTVPFTDPQTATDTRLILADEYEAGLRKMEASGYEDWQRPIQNHKMVIEALRFQARSSAPQAPPKLSDFAELKLLIDEYNPENSDWNFRRGVLLDILVRIWPTSSQVTRPHLARGDK